jgi:anti-sigma regulatory factor (Ser/Thr protein kinase)
MGEMFGFPRLHKLLEEPECDGALISCMLDDLHNFTGPDWEQEDDVTFVTLERSLVYPSIQTEDRIMSEIGWQLLAEFSLPSQPGNERQAMQRVADIVEPLGLASAQLERLKTAVAETTMNAMEYGNRFQADLPAVIKVLDSASAIAVQVVDNGGASPIPEPEAPDLEAKLEGLQSPRGWGIFLIKSMVDEMRVSTDGEHHIVELIMKKGLEG